MFINIHLDKKEITEALKDYLEKKGYYTEKESLVTMQITKEEARESEIWDATISGYIPINHIKEIATVIEPKL